MRSERESNRQILESAAADLAAAQSDLALCQQEAAAAAASLAEIERQQEEVARRHLRHGFVGLPSAQPAGASRRTPGRSRSRGSRVWKQRSQGANTQVEAFGGQRGQLALEFESVTPARHRHHRRDQPTAPPDRIQEASRKRSAKTNLDVLRAEYATALGKRGSLEAVIAEHGYSTESVRRLFQSGVMQGGLAPVGVLADFLEVEPRYERVVEDFLRDELNYIVVKSWDAADEGLRLLRSDVDGRATFLVHPEDSQAKFSFVLDEAAHSAPPAAQIVPLKNTIRVLDGFGKSLEVILPKLRDGYIVPEAGVARGLALENPDAFFLSQAGECFHNVTVTGGKQRAEGPLSMKRELREVLRQLEELERALREEEMRVLTLGREIKDLSSLLERLEGEKREAEQQAMTSGHMLQQLDSEMARVSERLQVSQLELRRLAAERAEQEGILCARQSEIEVLELQRIATGTANGCRTGISGSASAAPRSSRRRRRRSMRLAWPRWKNGIAPPLACCSALKSLFAEMGERVHALASQIEAAAAEKLQRETENEQLAQQAADLEAERNAGADARRPAAIRNRTTPRSSCRNRRATAPQPPAAGPGSRPARRTVRSRSQAAIRRAIHVRNLPQRTQHRARSADGRHDSGRRSAATNSRPKTSFTAICARKLEAMGPVNMMALEEYKETAERHAFLETQRKDLISSIENTTATIREIDQISRQKFEEAFTKINENFQATFKKLFGGGHGFMKLTDEENSAESGIDVVASPPGKRLQSVLLLSGGEKALTALALLVGIFQYAPSPFCILDEVDAPLDEANVGRFTELVKEMSVQTQFVLITHSKKTMSIAPVLYGVTMQEPGVSKLVSVRFGAQ